VRPLCDAEKSEGEGRVPDRGQHVVRGAGSTAENGPAVHGGVADRRGKTRHVAGEDFKAPHSAPDLGKRRPREGAGEPGCQGGGTARARAYRRAGARAGRGLPEIVGLAMFD
jgi:hypothetical protein